MGFQVGEGLGKFGQGRSNIVEASKQRGRRGLGFSIEGLDADDVEWVETDKEVKQSRVKRDIHVQNVTAKVGAKSLAF